MASDQEETRATGESSGPGDQGSITVSRTDLEQLIVSVVQREMANQQQRPGDPSAAGAGGLGTMPSPSALAGSGISTSGGTSQPSSSLPHGGVVGTRRYSCRHRPRWARGSLGIVQPAPPGWRLVGPGRPVRGSFW